MSPVAVRQMAAVVIGNALEFYDFLTYAFFAVHIGHAFFPTRNPSSSLLLSLATFGVGFLMRPVGGVVIGRMGDRIGRKPAMLLSFSCMGIAMTGLALTPGYASIGIAAPILVIAFRLLQGFALGGEVGPTTAYLVEAAPPEKRGLYASLQYSTQGLAVMTAGCVGVVLARVLDPQALDAWGWRVAFLIGTLIVPFGLVIRRSLPETYEGQSKSEIRTRSMGVRPHLRVASLGLVMLASGTIAAYVLDYLTTFATVTLHTPADVAFGTTVIVGLSDFCLSPVSGWLSDRYGRKPAMMIPWSLLFLLVVPAFVLITRFPTPAMLLGVTAVLAVMNTFGGTPVLVSLTEALPVSVRSGAVAITYAVAISTFGGTAQFIVSWLIVATGSPLAPAWYMMTAVGIGFAAMIAMRETAPVRAAVTPEYARA
jgi:MHS family citrate/tricarballylate:H+ symporter-like MFS transporter